jgi:hypothetical protein
MVRALPQKHGDGDGEAGDAAGATMAERCYGLQRRRLGRLATPLKGADRGTTFLHEGKLRWDTDGGAH